MAHFGGHFTDFEKVVFSVSVGLQKSVRSDWSIEMTFVSALHSLPFTIRATLKSQMCLEFLLCLLQIM